jgi:hypothetical protein
MATLKIQNRTRNPYIIPAVLNAIVTGGRMIAVGMTGSIDADKHAALMGGNRAYRAMVEQKKLIVSPMKIDEVNAEELENTSDPQKPADLDDVTETTEGKPVEHETKSIQIVEMEVETEALTPAQKGAATRAKNKAASNPPAQK